MKKNIFAALIFTVCLMLNGCIKGEASSQITADYVRDYLIVVNSAHPYEFGGEYDLALQDDLAVTTQATTGDDELLEYKALENFIKLRAAAQREGIIIGVLSGYRSKSDQEWLYNNYTLTEQVPAGQSEHHTGLNISLIVDDYLPDGDGPYWLSEGGKIPENERLTEMLPDYGFIRRYPAGKEDITGHEAAPYEIRFVGDAETAHAIMDEGLCLEEYVFGDDIVMACG